uniref:Uncharacterized protein n=1 Tax=Anguilla anguilla TaxID=7936 RepID=A0A0E9TA73_ANGAN
MLSQPFERYHSGIQASAVPCVKMSGLTRNWSFYTRKPVTPSVLSARFFRCFDRDVSPAENL